MKRSSVYLPHNDQNMICVSRRTLKIINERSEVASFVNSFFPFGLIILLNIS